ncbi:hypothetical protein B0J13DRAFT_540937 [Dactylonectria estremocensis]|uniref:Uncharacterized protein n=1 Tax=Dactylonectria estremocensis TaxID=1079267 RepID=A0A9P9FCD9_9HYPO|nr:hypothetical protein B0J13DRAFT_540937 [Dactylonectria estremocensis]
MIILGKIMSTVLITEEPASGWPSTSLRAFFLYDTNHPASIAASVVAVDTSSSTYVVTCPSSCVASDFLEQTITHIAGSSWAGERTWEGTTTSWGCNLGTGGDDVLSDQYGECSATTVSGGKTKGDVGESSVNSCFVIARSVPAYITDGMDKVYAVHPYYISSLDADGYISAISEELLSLGCGIMKTEETTEPAITEPSATDSAAEGRESTAAPEPTSHTVAETSRNSGETAVSTSVSTETDAPSSSSRVSVNLAALVGLLLLGTWLLLQSN